VNPDNYGEQASRSYVVGRWCAAGPLRLCAVEAQVKVPQESGIALTGKKTEPSAETSRRHAAAGGACDEGRQDRQEALCNDWADQRYTVRKQRRTVMTQKVIEVVGTSTGSFAKAAENAVAEAAQTVRGLKWARVAELEMELDGKKITQYRATAKIYFDIEH